MGRADNGNTSRAPLLLTVDEACDALRVSRSQLYDLFNKRRLRSVRINRRRFIVPADLTALIEELREEGGDNVR
jgi:excisionase family DNA binding protein